jgi:hypothetical protein
MGEEGRAAKTAPVPGAPGALRIPPDRDGTRAVARAADTDDWGDRHLADGESRLTYRWRCSADFKPVLVRIVLWEPVARRDLTVVQS